MLLVPLPESFTPQLCCGVLYLTSLCQLMSTSVHQVEVESPDTQISSQGLWIEFFDKFHYCIFSWTRHRILISLKKKPLTNLKRSRFFFFFNSSTNYQILIFSNKAEELPSQGRVCRWSLVWICSLFYSNEVLQESTGIFFCLPEMSAWNPISSSNTECVRHFMGNSVCVFLSFCDHSGSSYSYKVRNVALISYLCYICWTDNSEKSTLQLI